MADLNFDELDQAVNNYMKKDGTPAKNNIAPPKEPTPSPVEPSLQPPVAKPVETAVPPAHPVAASASPPQSSQPTPAASRVQLHNRQSIRRTAPHSMTFHDIMPAHRRSPVTPNKRLEPVSDVTSVKKAPGMSKVSPSVPPPKAPLPEESKAKEPTLSKPESVLENATPPPHKQTSVQPAKPTSPPDDANAPKILGAASEPDANPVTPPAVPPKENKTPATAPEDQDGKGFLMHGSSSDISLALKEDLEQESQKAALPKEPAATPTEEKAADQGLLASTPLDLIDQESGSEKASHQQETTPEPPVKSAAKKPEASGGLLGNTGELLGANATTSTPVDASHMLGVGADDQHPMKVFDTKEYHTPIAGTHHQAPSKNKVWWEWVLVIVLLTIVAAAGFVVYTIMFG